MTMQWDMTLSRCRTLEEHARVDLEGAWERFAGPVARLTPQLPEDVIVGSGFLSTRRSRSPPMYEARDYEVLVPIDFCAVGRLRSDGRLGAHGRASLSVAARTSASSRALSVGDVADLRVCLAVRAVPRTGCRAAPAAGMTASRCLERLHVAMFAAGREPGIDGIETIVDAGAGRPGSSRSTS